MNMDVQKKDLFLLSVLFVNPWRIWYPKQEKTTQMWRNMRLNFKTLHSLVILLACISHLESWIFTI
jgi:hypothetical protein